MFKTVSFHLVKPCNMKCKYCFATFKDFHVDHRLSLTDAVKIIDKLHYAGVEKITFAGGEPLLYKYLPELISYTKSLGITTSIITNGALLTDKLLLTLRDVLDWIGLSIDSINPLTNIKIGRIVNHSNTQLDYKVLIAKIKMLKYKLKINTVVSGFNDEESIQEFITTVNPDRWKIFEALRVKGQNDEHWADSRTFRFKEYVARHFHPNMCIEDNNLMTSSYVLIDPVGRIFDDTYGTHTYSDSLINYSVEHCLSQVNLSKEKFIARGGIYNW